MTDLSVVVVSWNTRELLRRCLAAVPAAAAGLDVQTVVVDNASRDGSADMVRREFPQVETIDAGANLGFARANNLALPRCRGRRIALLNPDTVAAPGSLATLVAFLDANPGAAACGPLLTDADGRPTLSWGTEPRLRYHLLSLIDPQRRWLPRRWRVQTLARVPDDLTRPREVGYVVGACLVATREAWERVGPLDERFFLYFEESDWCLRARRAGLTVHLVPDAVVAHLEGGAAGGAGDFALAQFQRSYRLFVAKHQGGGRVPLYRAAMFLEYGLKGSLRRLLALAPGADRERHAAQARDFLRIARLQLSNDLSPPPPS